MSFLGTKTKQPIEKLDFDIEYDDWITPNDGVESITTLVEPADELSIPLYNITPNVVKLWTLGGLDGVTYKITVTATTEDGRVKQDEFKVKVKET